tara:strand:+ start:44 stop:1048 length:1005 start_codon:yes stop_codon:yes gene_type:complete
MVVQIPAAIGYGVWLIGGAVFRAGSKAVATRLAAEGAKKLSGRAINNLSKNPKNVENVSNLRKLIDKLGLGKKPIRQTVTGQPKATITSPKQPASNTSLAKPKPSAAANSKPTGSRVAPKKPTKNTTVNKRPNVQTSTAKPQVSSSGMKTVGSSKAGQSPNYKFSRARVAPAQRSNNSIIARELVRPDAPEVDDLAPLSPDGPARTVRTKKNKAPKAGPARTVRTKKNKAPKAGPARTVKTAAGKGSPKKTKKKVTNSKPIIKPKNKSSSTEDLLKNYSPARQKALQNAKIGTDAGDGMSWVVGSNSNALVRVKSDSPRVSENKRLKSYLKNKK